MGKSKNSSIVEKSIQLNHTKLSLEIGRVAKQANAAVLARLGDTVVLVTVVASKERTDLDYFPLFVQYVEKLYAGGRIKGSRWVKREGRPSDEATLNARLIDRSIRPLFPKGFKKEVQVVVTLLSVDGENDPEILSLIATSAALHVSDIPWRGPIGAVRIGLIPEKTKEEGNKKASKGQFLINPGSGEMAYSAMNLVISATTDKVVMIEADMKQCSEETILSAITFAHHEIKKIIKLIDELRVAVGKPKQSFTAKVVDPVLLTRLEKDYHDELHNVTLKRISKEPESEDLALLADSIVERYGEEVDKKTILQAIDVLFKKYIRHTILNKKKRPDGRGASEIRSISGEVGVLPRTHGSAIFTRGQTQALTITTLAAPSLEQLIESPEGEETKRYMHHYYMPPYSVGETGRFGWPSRREIGHGALAERALLPVIPSEETFPYTIRVVSEIMSSNGSTSMAAVCGSTMSLMDAGVPIKEPVAGIAMGLVSEAENYVILSDIQGIEDFTGDMDFKVAGTKNGVTAIQLDVKIDGLTPKQIEETLKQAESGRLYILEEMLKVLPESRPHLSQFAPKIKVLRIPTDKIGDVIGPGGKVIRNIIAQTQTTVDIDDDGTVTVSAPNEKMVEKAIEWIKGLVKEVKPGEIYEGAVKRILPFGAFVEIVPGKEGLVHVSQMSRGFVSDPHNVVQIGQRVKVRVTEIDSQGRINLSMLLQEDSKAKSNAQVGRFDRHRSGYRRERRPFRARTAFLKRKKHQ